MTHCTPHTLTKVVHRNCQTTLLSYSQKESAWSLHVRDKTRQELYYVHHAASTVQGTSRAQRTMCFAPVRIWLLCVKTIMNIVQVLWRTALANTTVAGLGSQRTMHQLTCRKVTRLTNLYVHVCVYDTYKVHISASLVGTGSPHKYTSTVCYCPHYLG